MVQRFEKNTILEGCKGQNCEIRKTLKNEALVAKIGVDTLENELNSKKWCKFLEKSQNSGLMQGKKCKSRKALKNEALVAKIGVDTLENELENEK